MPASVYQSKGTSTVSWSEAANDASQKLYKRLETKLGKGKFTLVSLRVVDQTATLKNNPGSIQSYALLAEVTVSTP